MTISAETVKELRKRTQAGFMECKKALEEAGGDIEQAITIIRKRGTALANKRASRNATEGVIGISDVQTSGGSTVVLFEVNSETDFVAKNDMFQKAVTAIGSAINTFSKANPGKEISLTQAQELTLTDNDTTQSEWKGHCVTDLTQQLSGTIGEKIELSRVCALSAKSGEYIFPYAHAGNKTASAVRLRASKLKPEQIKDVGKDVAMQVVASTPRYLTESDVAKDELEKEKEVYLSQAMASGKPREIAEKMVMGKLKNYYKQVCLLDQPFIREPKISVAEYVEQKSKELDDKIELSGFIRLSCGENQ